MCNSVSKGDVFVCIHWNSPLLVTHFIHCVHLWFSLHQNYSFPFFLLSSCWCTVFSVLISDFLTNLWLFRLNNLKRAAADTLEGNKSVAYMDLRDNQMTDLDLSSLVSLEQLHCERNKLRELTLSGFSLRALYASSNCMSLCLLHLPFPFKPWEQRKTASCPLSHIKKMVIIVKPYVMGPLRLACTDHICMCVPRLCNAVEVVMLCPRNSSSIRICLGAHKETYSSLLFWCSTWQMEEWDSETL